MSDARDDSLAAWRPQLGALIAVVVWGASFVATKAALRELEPIPLVVLRFALGVLFLLAILVWRREPPLPPRSTCVAAFLYLEPLATLAAARAALGEPLEPITLFGGLLVLAGVAIVQRSA